MARSLEVYENTLANLDRYLQDEGMTATYAQQTVQLFRRFHIDLTDIYGQSPDMVLASKPRRYLVGGRPMVLIQIIRPSRNECHANEVGKRLLETLSEPLRDSVVFGLEYNFGKPFPFRHFLSQVFRFNPLGILRGNLA